MFAGLSKTTFILSIAIVSVVCQKSIGQGNVLSHNKSLDAFDKAVGFENTGILNGTPYKMSFFSATTNPFFSSGEVPGTIRFRGSSYSAPILYDLYQDEVVIKHISAAGNAWFVKLNKGDIDEFVLGNRLFRNINGSFYEVLFDGESFKVFARRTKIELVKRLIASYVAHDEYYLVKDSSWSRITGPIGLTRLLENKEDKGKVTSFMREQRIRRKRFTHSDIGNVAKFIDTLPLKK
jgi:hypothetical protein